MYDKPSGSFPIYIYIHILCATTLRPTGNPSCSFVLEACHGHTPRAIEINAIIKHPVEECSREGFGYRHFNNAFQHTTMLLYSGLRGYSLIFTYDDENNSALAFYRNLKSYIFNNPTERSL